MNLMEKTAKSAGIAQFFALICIALAAHCPAHAKEDGSPAAATLPYTVQTIEEPGPMMGVMVKVNLADPRVKLKVALADDRDTDGAGPCVGLLDTTQQAAKKHNFAVAINASFFAVPTPVVVAGRKLSYVVGNCGYPVGWHVADGKTITRPVNDKLRATLWVGADGRANIADGVKELPEGTRFAVSGNALILSNGQVNRAVERGHAPTTAVGLSADGNTLFLAVVDGRQPQWSKGADLVDMAQLMQRWGAHQAINFDGGGSSTLVLKDHATGVFTTVNRPSDVSASPRGHRLERAVIDVIGISLESTSP
jgi:hypothetical protein